MSVLHIALSVALGLIALYCALLGWDEFSWRKNIGNVHWSVSTTATVVFGGLAWLSWTAS